MNTQRWIQGILVLGMLVAFGLVTGCASTKQALPMVSEEKPTSDKALIIVEGSEPFCPLPRIKLRSVNVYDNNTFVGKLGPQGKLAWLRNPGQMELTTKKGTTVSLSVDAGKVYRYQIGSHMNDLYAPNGPGTTKYDLRRKTSESLVFFKYSCDFWIKNTGTIKIMNRQAGTGS